MNLTTYIFHITLDIIKNFKNSRPLINHQSINRCWKCMWAAEIFMILCLLFDASKVSTFSYRNELHLSKECVKYWNRFRCVVKLDGGENVRSLSTVHDPLTIITLVTGWCTCIFAEIISGVRPLRKYLRQETNNKNIFNRGMKEIKNKRLCEGMIKYNLFRKNSSLQTNGRIL